jgi:hypothetical protein
MIPSTATCSKFSLWNKFSCFAPSVVFLLVGADAEIPFFWAKIAVQPPFKKTFSPASTLHYSFTLMCLDLG